MQKFPQSLKVKIYLAEHTAKMHVVLNNFVRERDCYNIKHTLYIKSLYDILTGVLKCYVKYGNNVHYHFPSNSGSNVRQVPWQHITI
jgi:hypothetical protein